MKQKAKREMKVVVYFVAFLVCVVGMETSNGRMIEEKRKFASMSNKGREDALIQCYSGKESLNKTVRAGEKIRWGLAGSMICRLQLGTNTGYFFPFLSKYCNKECKWRVFDDGMLNLNLGGGEWKSVELQMEMDDESPTQAPAESPPPPMKRHGKSKPPAPVEAPAPSPENVETAHASRKLKYGPAPGPSTKLKPLEAPPPTQKSSPPTNPDAKLAPTPDTPSPADDPQPSPPHSTFYSCIKEDDR